jgi:hypothetical protein
MVVDRMSIRRNRPLLSRSVLNDLDYDPPSKRKAEFLERLRPRDSKHSRLESLRASPYMFFHGESSDYSEAVRQREEEQKALATRPQPGDKKATFAYSVVPKASPILLDNIFDDLNSDAFAGGSVLKTVAAIRSRRRGAEATSALKNEDVPPNLRTLRKVLLNCAAPDANSKQPNQAGWNFESSGDILVSVAAFKREFRFLFDIESEQLLDLLIRDVTSRPLGRPLPETVSFHQLYELFEKYVVGDESRGTSDSCFSVIDRKGSQTASLNSMRELRGLAESALPKGMRFSMLKATMNIFLCGSHSGLTISDGEFYKAFLEQDALVCGFMEQIVRHILVKHFGHDRLAIAALYSR